MTKKTYKNFKGGLKTIPEYSELIPPMSKLNFDQLLDNIKKDGVIREPITIDKENVILDGHNRYTIAEKLDMGFETLVNKDISSIEGGEYWIINNQIGRRKMSQGQLAVLGLKLVSRFRKLGKIRQSKGGKDKIKLKKGFKTTEQIAKKVGVNETIIKDIISINKPTEEGGVPELIPFIRVNSVEVKQAKHLQELRLLKEIKDIVVEGLLTDEAKRAINLFENPLQTEEEVAADKAVKEAIEAAKKAEEAKKKAKKAKAAKAAKKKKAKEKAAKEAKEAKEAQEAKEAKEAQEAQDKLDREGGDPPLPGGGGQINPLEKGLIKGTIEKLSEDHERKLSIFMSRIEGEVKNEKKEGKIFTEKATFINAIESPQMITEGYLLECSIHRKENTESGYPSNVIMAVPNNQLYRTWNQKISKASNSYCDSKKLPVRFIYFGKDIDSFINHFEQYGNMSTIIKIMPNVASFSESLKDLKEVFTPPKTKKVKLKTKKKGA